MIGSFPLHILIYGDTITICKVDKPNPDYRFGTSGDVVNWFDQDDFKPGYYSIKDTLGALMAHPGTGAIVGRMMAQAAASRGDVATSTSGIKTCKRCCPL